MKVKFLPTCRIRSGIFRDKEDLRNKSEKAGRWKKKISSTL
jgi:hypothetical protein